MKFYRRKHIEDKKTKLWEWTTTEELPKQSALIIQPNYFPKSPHINNFLPRRHKIIDDDRCLIDLSTFSDVAFARYLFLRKENINVYVGNDDNPLLGRSLFAARDFVKHQLICMYEGERLSNIQEEQRRLLKHDDSYMFDLGFGIVIDAVKLKRGGAMTNSSCEPNATLEVGFLDETTRFPVGYLRSRREIKAGSCVTVHYGLDKQDVLPANVIACHCGALSCNKKLGWTTNLSLSSDDDEGSRDVLQ